jgi:signal transduction histidine kinase
VRNAIRHAPRDSKVEVALENGGGHATVRVRDYGTGVPADALPRLFDPFYRVDTDRNRGSGGVGLGLSIARRAVELHKGSLHASNAGPGLLVEIELPA